MKLTKLKKKSYLALFLNGKNAKKTCKKPILET
jgi:hypothetical protein